MVATLVHAAAAAIDDLRTLVHIPLEHYYPYLPRMPHGEKPADLIKVGFPQAGDLLDGALLVAFLTLLRLVITPLLLKGLGRVLMKHRYYRTRPDARLDAMLQCVRMG